MNEEMKSALIHNIKKDTYVIINYNKINKNDLNICSLLQEIGNVANQVQ